MCSLKFFFFFNVLFRVVSQSACISRRFLSAKPKSTAVFNSPSPSKGDEYFAIFANCFIVPFKTEWMLNLSVCLKLPSSLKVRPTFHVSPLITSLELIFRVFFVHNSCFFHRGCDWPTISAWSSAVGGWVDRQHLLKQLKPASDCFVES